MTQANAITPVKIGLLLDMIYPAPPAPWDNRADLLDSLRLQFDFAYETGQIDRPVEMILREVEGLPRGSVQAVIDACRELVFDEKCVMLFGPMISENAPAVREYIEREARVPTIGMMGTEDFLGEWTFSLSNGSMPDEPYVLASTIAQAGHRRVGVTSERSLIGAQYLSYFKQACKVEGIELVAEALVPQTGLEMVKEVQSLRAHKPDAIAHFGFGWAIIGVNAACAELNWDIPKYCATAWEGSFFDEDFYQACLGWIGQEQFHEENMVGKEFLDRFEKRYGRRPEYYMTVYGHDVANVMSIAIANAEPLSPLGLKQSIERVRMLPSACGTPDTRISFGSYTHRGWMGTGYLVAREHDPNNRGKTIYRGRIAPPKKW